MFSNASFFIVKGVLHPLLKISMFCALSQNNQHLTEKLHMHLMVNCSWNSKMVFKLWIKTVKMFFGSITQELLGLLKL